MRFYVLLSTLLLLAPSLASANDMRIYGFTSEFINCIKAHSDESYENVRVGNSDSALMNGSAELSGGALGDNYWSYMNCLTRSNAGTMSTSLGYKSGCNELSISYGSKQLYLPPGLKGKRVGIAGREFVCNGSSWQQEASAGEEPDDGNNNESCEEKSKSVGACRFDFPEALHGTSKRALFGPAFGYESDHEGEAVASCRNGQWEVVESTCEPVSCDQNAEVYWQGESQYGGITPRCTAQIAFDGFVMQGEQQRAYYPTEEMARLMTIITYGRAQFVCASGRWEVARDSNGVEESECALKTQNELNCYSEMGPNHKRKYYCE